MQSVYLSTVLKKLMHPKRSKSLKIINHVNVLFAQDSELFIYKDKKSPEFVIALNDAEIRIDPRKENKFIVTSSTHKVSISHLYKSVVSKS